MENKKGNKGGECGSFVPEIIFLPDVDPTYKVSDGDGM
jgi:hypothetical protein